MSRFAITVIAAVLTVQCIEASVFHPRRGGVILATTNMTQDEQNAKFDRLLTKLSALIKNSTLDTYSMKDTKFNSVQLVGGVLKDLSDLKRVGDAVFSTDDSGTTKMTGQISVENLEADFDNFSISLPIFTIGGKATVKITNSADVEVTYSTGSDSKCTTSLNKLDVTDLTPKSIKFDSFTILNKLFEFIAPSFLGMFKPLLIAYVGSEPQALGKVLLNGLDICSL